MGIVYRAMNRVNGKSYIGITTGRLERRQWGHTYEVRHGSKKPFHSAIRKYGLDAFDWIVIEEHETDADLMAAEIRLIAELRPEYNIAKGGKCVAGLRHSEETRAKLSAAMTPERRARMSKLRKGVPHTPEAIAKMKASQTPERIARFSAKRKGYKHRPDTVARLSEVGLQNRDKWEPYRAMGPAALARSVICIDTGIVYPSVSEAARQTGAHKDALAELCKGQRNRQTAGGLRFAFVDGSTPPPGPDKRSKLDATQVAEIKRRLRLGESSPSIAKDFGVNRITIVDIKIGRSWKSVEAAGVPA